MRVKQLKDKPIYYIGGKSIIMFLTAITKLTYFQNKWELAIKPKIKAWVAKWSIYFILGSAALVAPKNKSIKTHKT